MSSMVIWIVALVFVSTVFGKRYQDEFSASGSHEEPSECCKHKELTQEKQNKTYYRGFSDFNAQKWSFDGSKKNGPATWCKKYPECGGKNQSPINIETKYVECDEDLTDFSYRGYDTIPTMEMPVFHLKAWQAVSFEQLEADITIRIDWLESDFTLYFIYLWTGSAHQIDGEGSPLQIGLVHWNSKKYATQLEAENKPDGVVSLAVSVKVAKDETKLNTQFTDAIDNLIAGAGNTTYIPNFPLTRLLPSCRMYYKYQGSYYIPNCGESVTWIIFREPLNMSRKQFQSLNKALSGSKKQLKNNSRPMQPLNGRIVYSIC